jgi:hypothetical protein
MCLKFVSNQMILNPSLYLELYVSNLYSEIGNPVILFSPIKKMAEECLQLGHKTLP